MTGAAEAQAAPLNETELAEEVAAGRLPSGFDCGGYRLWALRISGTGPAARPAHKEVAIRDAGTWLSPEMIRRCTGLPVVIEHPPSGQLDGESFAQRAVGVVMLAYPRNGALWGVAKVFDADANAALEAGACSTSPSVVFAAGDGGQVLDLGDGKRLHMEGDPARIDHLALVPDAGGVWDRGVPGRGVRCDSNQHGERTVSETMMDADNAPPDAVLAALNKLASCMADMAGKLEATGGRLDKMCARMDNLESARAKDGERDADPNYAGARLTAADSAKPAPKTIEEEREENRARAHAQLRADRACVAFGERAPPPMLGEDIHAYRRRLMRPFLRYSVDWKSVDLDGINDPKVLDVVEERVFSDAIKAAENCEHMPENNGPYPITRTDPSGRQIVEWRGRRTFISNLRPNGMRAKVVYGQHSAR